jgi:hypothetical protein
MSAFRNLSLHRMRGNKRYPKKVPQKIFTRGYATVTK